MPIGYSVTDYVDYSEPFITATTLNNSEAGIKAACDALDAMETLVSTDGLLLNPSLESEPTYANGLIFIHPDEKCPSVYTGIDGVVLNLSQELTSRGVNATGGALPNGTIGYMSGVLGNRPTIAPAQANSATTAKVYGIFTHDVANNVEGFVTHIGLVHDLDTSAFEAGDTLYLSATVPGAFTNVAPSAPDYVLEVGRVLVSHATQGIIFFSVPSTSVLTGIVVNSVTVNNDVIVGGSINGRDIEADGTKLDGIESGATADQTANEILTALRTVDGTGSELDADKLDGNDSTYFATASNLVATSLALQSEIDSDISTHAAIADAHHTNANDPTAGEKAALAGTSGTPSALNKYATDEDSRLSDARTPTSHASEHVTGGSDVIPDAIPLGNSGLMSGSDKDKLDNIEALADVTDSDNVAAAGAVMEADTTTAGMSFVLDEDDMVSDSDIKLATQQSIKAYVDAVVSAILHNSTQSIQGGTTDEYYHLTSDELNDVQKMFMSESYINATGTFDNFCSKVTETGSLVITENSSDHAFDFATGTSTVGDAVLDLDTVVNTNDIDKAIMSFRLSNFSDGSIVDSTVHMQIGFIEVSTGKRACATFYSNSSGISDWQLSNGTAGGSGSRNTGIYPSADDYVSVVLTSSLTYLYINGNLEVTYANNIPVGVDLKPVVYMWVSNSTAPTVEYTRQFDYIRLEVIR
jgi:hypothetical protein